MSDIPKKFFTADYYDEAYFRGEEGGKTFYGSDGKLTKWSYFNPDGESLGCKIIMEAWVKMLTPKSMLDVGAGRGTVVTYARDLDVEAYGFDWSEWAVNEGRYPRCNPEWLIQFDATGLDYGERSPGDRKKWPYPDNHFDLVTAMDLLEHIYTDDIPFVVSELVRVAKKYIFLQTAVVFHTNKDGLMLPGGRHPEKGYILKKGEPVPLGLEGNAVAGHVTVQPEQFWIDHFEQYDDLLLRRDLKTWFISLVPPHIIKNWLVNSMLFFEVDL